MRVIDKLRRFNWLTLISMVALIVIGTVAIWSSGSVRQERVFHGMWISNLVTAFIGLLVYIAIALFDYRSALKIIAVPAYVVAIVLLVAVLVFGSTVYGGKRWLWFFQPSEIAKICVLMMLAHVYGPADNDGDGWRRSLRGFLLALGLVGVPALLILLEPDLGTALTLVPAALVMMLAARIWRKGMVAIIVGAVLACVFVLGAVYEAERPGTPVERRERILRMVPLKAHQLKRVKVFLFPEADAAGAGYNLRQSMISIGTGGLIGRGIGKGESNMLKYLPQSISMNDFIFCVWAEETGFIGSLTLLVLFGVLLVSAAWTASLANDGAGRLLAVGIPTLVFAHVFVNIAMSVGLVPITGLPLPFISSGKTFLLTAMAGMGLVQSVAVHGRLETRD